MVRFQPGLLPTNPSMMRTPGSVRMAAYAALSLLVLVASCTDGGAPIAPRGGDGAVGLVLERSLFPRSAEATLPINRIRAVARLVPGGKVVGEVVLDVSPAESWAIELDLDLGAMVSAVVQVTFELINVDAGGVESVQFSGRTGPILVIPGRDARADGVEVVRGGLGNLDVTALQINEPLAALVEGAIRGLSATVTTSAPNLQTTVFWSSLDPTATVTGSAVTGVLPGTARIVAVAGTRADTALLTILARPAAARVTPESSDAVLGATLSLTGVVVDPRGAVISGQSVLWRTLSPTVLEEQGEGRFRAVGAGQGFAEVRAAADTLLKDTAVVRVSRPATDVGLAKTASASSANEGDIVTFLVTVSNPSSVTASGVRVREELPSGLTLFSTTASVGSFAAGTWTVGDLAAGASATLQVRATVRAGTAGTTVTNVVRMQALDGQLDQNSANDQASAAVIIAARTADLAVTKEVADGTLLEGDTAHFTVTVTNRGPADAGRTVVAEELPTGLTYVSHTESRGRFNAATRAWTIGDLPAGASETLEIRALVANGTAGETLLNRARVSSIVGASDPTSANDTASAAVLVGESGGGGGVGPFDQTFHTVGNTALFAGNPEAPYMLHVTDPDDALAGSSGLVVTSVGELETALGGTVIMDAAGAFIYLPPHGVAGAADSVRFYTMDGNEDEGSARLDLIIEATRVWYVDNATADGGNEPGTSWSPIQFLGDANEYASVGDVIYVAEGNQAYGGIQLRDEQTLIGSHAGLTLVVGGAPQTIAEATTGRPWITGPDGTGIEMSNDGVVRGVGVTSSFYGISAAEVTNGSVTDVELTDNYTGLILDYTGGTYTIDDVVVMGSTETGITLENTSGTYDFTGLSVVHPGSGPALDITGGDASIDVDGTILSDTLAGAPLSVGNTAGSIILSGNVEGRGSAGIEVYGVGGSLTIDAAIALSHSTDNGFSMYTSTGNVRLAGGLVIEGTNGSGLEAMGGGTLEIVGSANWISDAGCGAVSIDLVTIGPDGVTFESVSTDGTCVGIYLSDTGESGPFAVSGGVIRNSQTAGIQLFSANDVWLQNMDVTNAQESGVYADEVVDLILTNVTVTDNSGQLGHDAIYLQNVTGAVTLTGVTASSSSGRALVVNNSYGSLELDVFGLDAEGGNYDGAMDAFIVNAQDGAVMTVLVQGANIRSDGGAAGLRVRPWDASSIDVTVQGSTFTNVDHGIDLYQSGTGNLTYHVSENTFVSVGIGIYAWTGDVASGQHTGLIEYNDNDANTGIEIVVDGTVQAVVAIHDDVIGGEFTDVGIYAAINDEASLALTVIGNVITVNNDSHPIDIDADGWNSQNPSSLCLDLRGNEIHTPYSLFRIRQQGFSTFQIRGLPEPSQDETVVDNVIDFLLGQNPQWQELDVDRSVSGDYATAEACGLPPGYEPPPFIAPPPSPHYEAIGNTLLGTNGWIGEPPFPILVAGPGVLDGTTGLTVTSLGPMETQYGGTVEMEADGDFLYTPPTGVTGTSDYFNYTVEGGQTGEVTINLIDQVWYIDNAAPAGGTGRSHEPFDDISEALGAADGTPATFYVATGAEAYTGSVSLNNNQRLIGAGVDLVMSDYTLALAGSRPLLSNSTVPTSVAVDLNGSNEVAGLDIDAPNGTAIQFGGETGGYIIDRVSVLSSSGRGISANTVAGVVLNQVTVANTTAQGVMIAYPSGTWTVTDLHVQNTQAAALEITNAYGDVAISLAPGSIRNGEGDGPPLVVTGTSAGGSVTITGDSIVSAGAEGILIESNEGAVTIEAPIRVTEPTTTALAISSNMAIVTLVDVMIESTGGDVPALHVDSSAVDLTLPTLTAYGTVSMTPVWLVGVSGSIHVDQLDVRADGDEAVALFAQTVESVSTSGGTAIASNGAGALYLSDVGADLQLDSINVSGSGTAPGVTLFGVSGTIAIDDGTIAGSQTSSFVMASGNTADVFYGGDIEHESFDHSVIVQGSTGGIVEFAGSIVDNGGGIALTDNTEGTEIYFTGALDVTVNAGNTPFLAENNLGAELRVQTQGPAVIRGTSVTNAVRIVNTGLHGNGVTFDSVFASSVLIGIEIAEASGGPFTVLGGTFIEPDQGVSITNFPGGDVTLEGLTIQDPLGDGIFASGLENITISSGSITNAGWELNGEGIDVSGLTGTLTIQGMSVTGSDLQNVLVSVAGIDQVAIDLSGSQLSNAGDNGFELSASDNANVSLVVRATTLDGNGDLVGGELLRRNGMVVGGYGNATISLAISDNTVFDGNTQHGLMVFGEAEAVFNIDIRDSEFAGNGNAIESGYGVRLMADNTTTATAGYSGFVDANTFTNNYDGGLRATLYGDSRSVLAVSGNSVTETQGEAGLAFELGVPTNGSSSEATLDLTLHGNTVTVLDQLSGESDGIRVITRGNNDMCLAATDGTNVVEVDVMDAATEASAANGSTFRVEDLASYTDMEDWLVSRFVITTGDAWFGKTSGEFTPVTAGTCATPTPPFG